MGIFNKKKGTDKDEDKKVEETATPSIAIPQSGDGKAYRVIVGPQVTEKATLANEEGKYVFRVQNSANKIEIKKAIQSLYSVKVKSVNLLRVPSKKRQVGRHIGERPGYKKAVVSLQKGEKIDIA